MVPFAVGGTGLWAIAGLILWAADAPTEWLRICLAGFLLGLVGVAAMVVRERYRRHRRRP
jgi:hypothetical protein